MSDGYIKLHRQLLESSVFANTTGLKIWIWCLLKATYKKRFMSMKIGKGNTTINLDIGQFVFGRFSAEEELSIDGSTIYKWMKKFESDGMIQLQSNSHYTLVTICNWNDYQQDEEQEVTTKEQPSNNQVTTKEQPSNTNKKVKNSKESKEDNIYDDFDVDEIYQAYPTKCHIKGRSLGKTSKNKDKIKTLLKTNSKDKLLKAINFYISDSKKNNVYKEYLTEITPESVSNDVKQTLKELKKLGYKLAIGSSSKNTPLILERIGYDKFFDAISDGNQIKNSKPHPEVFLLAAKKLGKKPEECLVVGDAESDILAANSAGMLSASIGYASTVNLGDYKLNTLLDLLNVLKSI